MSAESNKLLVLDGQGVVFDAPIKRFLATFADDQQLSLTDIEARSKEILTLSKMNWNSSDGITRLPVTLLFAKKVGEIMTELSDNVTPNPSFRFHT